MATVEESLTLEEALPILLASSDSLRVVDPRSIVTGMLRHADVAAILTAR